MMRCKETFSVLALLAPFALGAILASPVSLVSEAEAARGLPHLCYSSIEACTIQSVKYAPTLEANVCWDGRLVTLMGATGCPTGSSGYRITHGLIEDPTTNVVLAIAAVADTCEAGFCERPDEITASKELIDGVACCSPKSGECKAADKDGLCSYGDITWCEKLEDNGDGTVTCYE